MQPEGDQTDIMEQYQRVEPLPWSGVRGVGSEQGLQEGQRGDQEWLQGETEFNLDFEGKADYRR